MASRWLSTFSDDLNDACEIRRKRCGFKTRSDYLQSLARYDVACNVPHRHSAGWDKLKPAERDAMDAQLLADAKANKRPMVSSTKQRCHAVVQQLMGPLAPTWEEFAAMIEAREKADAAERGD